MPDERLIDFLYILGRDHLPLGALEDIMWSQVDTEKSSYCNSFLEDYARDLAERLTDNTRDITDWKHMRLTADAKAYRTDNEGEWYEVERGK